MAEIEPKDLQRFWAKVRKLDNCWLWMATKRKGYGRFRFQDRLVSAHRFSYELYNGEIPHEKVLDHLCKNLACVNPQHLEIVTQQENVNRGNTGLNNKIKTHCPQNHEYSFQNTYYFSNGRRKCIACHGGKPNG